MFKLVLEKAEEPEIKLPISAGSSKKQESSRKTSTSALLTMPKPLTVWITTVENSSRDGNIRPPYLPPEKSVCRSGSNSKNWTWNNRLVPNRKRSMSGYIWPPCLFNLHAEYIMRNVGLEEAQAGGHYYMMWSMRHYISLAFKSHLTKSQEDLLTHKSAV